MKETVLSLHGLKPRSTYQPPNAFAEEILSDGIKGPSETFPGMIERVVKALYSVESRWGYSLQDSQKEMDDLAQALDSHLVALGTPVLTNAGRNTKPLTSCLVLSGVLRENLMDIKKEAFDAGSAGMGAGYNFDRIKDPVPVLRALNEITIKNQPKYKHGRSIGNMATISVRHPKLLDFIQVKDGADERGEKWRFNLSVNVDDDFLNQVQNGGQIKLKNGKFIDASALYKQIIKSAWRTGEPGIVFMDRLNRDNPTPRVGLYTSVAPCAEVGLAPGETCQFGYINVGRCLKDASGQVVIDVDMLSSLSTLMTRTLDNAVEYNIDHALTDESKKIARLKRKIGVGIYGLADMLARMGLKYESPEAQRVARDVMAIINYSSKIASYELAKKRGSFGALNNKRYRSSYDDNPGFIERKYGTKDSTYVHPEDWLSLDKRIKTERLLRNASTTALPPTGKSSVIGGGSYSIEPYFKHFIGSSDGGSEAIINPVLIEQIRKLIPEQAEQARIIEKIKTSGRIEKEGGNEALSKLADAFDTALEVSIGGHIDIVVALQDFNDESVSKTINLREDVTPEEIEQIYLDAWNRGLKGITIFRDNSRRAEPQKLAVS